MKRYVRCGQVLNGVVYVTPNVVIHKLKEGCRGGKIVIIGNGNSLNVLDSKIVKCDPLMALPDYYYFDSQTTVFAVYYTFECEGLRAAAKDIANFMNNFLSVNEVILVGHSKSGVCFYDLCKNFINRVFSYTLITISPAFYGTVMVSPQDFYELKKRFNIFLRYVHKFVFSGHNVDSDISINSKYLKELLKEQTPLNGQHINVTTQMLTIKNCSSFQDYFCYFLEWATELESDGIVKREDQKIANSEEYFLDAPHDSSLRRGMMMLKEKNIINF